MNKFAIGIIIFSCLILIGGVFLVSSQSTSTSNISSFAYSLSAKEKPIAQAENVFFDMGKMKVSQQRQKDFTVKNAGSKPLQLSNISSSCGCTVAKIIYNGRESKEFGMHSQSKEIFEIAPNSQATIRVIYKPFIMPVYGVVEREVYVSTNDPQNQKLVFSIKAYVE